MKISAEWLREFVAIPEPEKLEELLLMAGLGVESREGERFELEVTSNRGDWLSAIGIAREVGAMTGTRARLPVPDVDEEAPAIGERWSASIEAGGDCSRYCLRLVEGVTIGPSPDWMQARLLDCGVRPINNVVDVTNYVMIEWGQPLHAFDASRLSGHQITVRRAQPGETLLGLDEQERELSAEELAICDASGPVALAGIIGGATTEVREDTRDVLLEAAHFDPARVRRGAYRLGVATEASRRFERHVDPGITRRALDRAAQLLASTSGGRVAAGVVEAGAAPEPRAPVEWRPDRANAVLGLTIPANTQSELLERLGFQVTQEEDRWSALAPSWRRDVEREVDLIEEIARLHGYDRVPTTLHSGANHAAGRALAGRLEDRARSACLRCGLTEVTTYSLSNEAAHERAGLSRELAVRLRNPLSEDYTLLRTSLVPSLLDVLARNRGRRLRAFEMGRVYLTRGADELPDERRVLGLALSAATPPPHWQGEGAPVDFFALKAIVENVLREFGAPPAVFAPLRHPALHPGRAASVSFAGEEIGLVGEVHPDVAARWDLSDRVYVGHIDFEAVVRHLRLTRRFDPISRFPGVDQDLALLVPDSVPAGDLLSAARAGAPELLESARVFDIYRGQGIPEGHASIALALRLRASDRTLTEAEIKAVRAAILERLERLGAHLRTL